MHLGTDHFICEGAGFFLKISFSFFVHSSIEKNKNNDRFLIFPITYQDRFFFNNEIFVLVAAELKMQILRMHEEKLYLHQIPDPLRIKSNPRSPQNKKCSVS